jgi:16S rRNA (guanine966-N2)-methyltransferase
MRVIAGEAKGRKLKMVPGSSTRPIGERVKEALFAILGEDVVDALFLDLYAGTGSVGIEALSRGAREATFVDQGRRAIATIRDNLAHTRLDDRGRVVRAEVFAFLRRGDMGPYDLIYVAPPQYRGLWARTLSALDGSSLLASGGLVVAQIHPKEYQPLKLETLKLTDQRKYGSTMLCFWADLGYNGNRKRMIEGGG